MPRGQSQQASEFPVELAPEQTQTKKYISFDTFKTMDTQPAREALEKDRLAWLENVIILAPNQLSVLPGPSATPLSTLTGETIVRMFYAFLNSVDYMVCFCASGAAYGVKLSDGTKNKFANAGTFSVTPDAAQWSDEALLIGDTTKGYCAWTGTIFAAPGTASPNFNIFNGGNGYTIAPTVTITGGTGSGAAATAILSGDTVTSIKMTNAGSGYLLTDNLEVFFNGGAPLPATVTSFQIIESGGGYSTAPTVKITTFPGDAGTLAAATAAVSGGAITGLTLVNGGSNYGATPFVSIDGGSGVTNATVTSPGNITVAGGTITAIALATNGSGYTSTPMVFIIGNGTGAAATATMANGTISAITVTSGGSGYTAGGTNVFLQGGGGAVVSAILDNVASAVTQVWPQTVKPTSLAVFQGRVWLGANRELVYSGTTGYSDFDSANAAGSTTITDSDLVHKITALRSLNNYLFIFGDNSIKQIGSVTVTNSLTNFSIVTLSSDIGTVYPMSIVSYNRLVIFCNTQGIYAIFGASVEKISDPMDGVFRGIDFSQEPVGMVADLFNLHTYQLLVRYNDPDTDGVESLFLIFTQKRWCVADQGNSMVTIEAAPTATSGQSVVPYGAVGANLIKLWTDSTVAREVEIQTALTFDSNPFINKRALRMGIAQSVTTIGAQLNVTLDTETSTNPFSDVLGFSYIWLNVNNQTYGWTNMSSNPYKFVGGSGFSYIANGVTGSGIYLGATLSGNLNGYNLHAITIEYQTGALFASINV